MAPSDPTPRVLLVDDEAAPRRAASRLLQSQLGVDIVETGGAMEALTAWRRQGPFDVAVIDLDMPEMNGLELLARFRTLAPELPVVVWTGRAPVPAGDLTHARAVLQKSAEVREFVNAVRDAIGGRGHRESGRQLRHGAVTAPKAETGGGSDT